MASFIFTTCFTRFGMKKTRLWQLFAIFSSWYQTAKTAFISLVRLVQSLKLSQFIITIPKFFTGFKSGELTSQSRTFIWFFLKHSFYFFSSMTWGRILLKNAPTTWKCCSHISHNLALEYVGTPVGAHYF